MRENISDIRLVFRTKSLENESSQIPESQLIISEYIEDFQAS